MVRSVLLGTQHDSRYNRDVKWEGAAVDYGAGKECVLVILLTCNTSYPVLLSIWIIRALYALVNTQVKSPYYRLHFDKIFISLYLKHYCKFFNEIFSIYLKYIHHTRHQSKSSDL